MIILPLIILILVLYLDLVLRKKKVSNKKLMFYETSAALVFAIYLLVETKNFAILTVIGTTVVSLAWVFKEFFANVGASLVMQLYPQFEKNDVLRLRPSEEPLIFEDVGFLRSVLKKNNGDVVYAPNSTLLNELVTVS